MPWISYDPVSIAASRRWHYNSTVDGLTTGARATTVFTPLSAGITASINYVMTSPLSFKADKNYYFETIVSNYDNTGSITKNTLRLRLGSYKTSGAYDLDFWQGPVKVIDYLFAPTSAYPVGTDVSTPIGTINLVSEQVLQFFSKPTADFTTERVNTNELNNGYGVATFYAGREFSDKNNNGATSYPNDASFIKEFKISELDFQVQGWAVQKERNFGVDVAEPGVIGWVYDSGTYSWRTWSTQSGVFRNAMGPNTSYSTKASALYGDPDISIVIASQSYSINNFIAKELTNGELFNISFNMIFSTQSGISPMRLYLDNQLPTTYTRAPQRGLLIATFTQSNSYNFYNLNGGQYLYFVGSTVSEIGLAQTGVRVDIGNFSITTGYSETDNNEQFAFQSSVDPYAEPTTLSIIGASSSSSYETVSITNQTVHETNSGPVGAKKMTYTPQNPTRSFGQVAVRGALVRGLDDSVGFPINTGSGFSTVGFFSNVIGTVSNLSQLYAKVGNGRFNAGVWENGVWNSGWRVDENVYEFNDISLSFNLRTENVRWRIQVEGSTYSVSKFEIGDRVSIGNIVAVDINDNRKLLKNYFTIVNKNDTTLIVEVDNAFPVRRIEKDSPNHKILITKNVWLNGGFLNGYFEGIWNDGLFKGYPLITEMYNTHWIDGRFDGGHFYSTKPSYVFDDTYYYNGYVGLTGATAHGLLTGDLITIDKSDKSVNPQYDGDHKITEIVDEYLAVTDILWGDNTTNESGVVTRRTATGLIQNFTFYDNNYSTLTSRETRLLKELWRYGSWIDVNFSDQSTTNINSSRIYNNSSTTNFLQWRDRQKFGIGDYGVLNLHGFITEDVLSSTSYFRGLDSVSKRAYSLGTKYEIYQDFLGEVSNFNNPFNSNIEEGNLDNFYADGWTWSFSGIAGGTYSYVNLFVKGNSSGQTVASQNFPPVWNNITFANTIEDSFGLLISTSSTPYEWQVSTTGEFGINLYLPAKFETTATCNPGLEGGLDNDYLYITGNITVGKIRILRYRNNTTTVLTEKTIKTSGSDFSNVGTSQYAKGESTATFEVHKILEVDWKGELQSGDKIRVQFQSCDSRVTSYNQGGPWRGSGFEQGFALNDNIDTVDADWLLKDDRTLTISNAGVNNSTGYNFRRTTDGTLLVEHLEDSYHSLTLNNTLIDIPRNRYSMIEFDLLQSPDSLYNPIGESYSFHFTDLYNFTTFINSDLSYSSTVAFPGVPYRPERTTGSASLVKENPTSKTVHWSGIDYTKTANTKKVEYFYNRPGLDLGLLAEQQSIFRDQVHELDNIKFYEVDMIPFFQYTTEEYVDRSVKIPYQGRAPFIDYTDADFSFVENIDLGLDSIELQETNQTFVSSQNNQIIFNPPAIGVGSSSGGSSTSGGSGPFIRSDRRFKTSIEKVSQSISGINIYNFRYIDTPEKVYQGVIAQELLDTQFESALELHSDGLYRVDYSKIDVEFKQIC